MTILLLVLRDKPAHLTETLNTALRNHATAPMRIGSTTNTAKATHTQKMIAHIASIGTTIVTLTIDIVVRKWSDGNASGNPSKGGTLGSARTGETGPKIPG